MQIVLPRAFLLPFAVATAISGACSGPSSSPSGSRVTTGAISSAAAHAPIRNQIPDTVVVERGDTLSSIAHRYRVSVGALLYVNDLKGMKIKTGQDLHIPSADTRKHASSKGGQHGR